MNVVSSPALASLASAQAELFPCVSGTCLLGWAWLMIALTLLSAWIVRSWHAGGNDAVARLIPAAVAATTAAKTLLPLPSSVAPQTCGGSARPDPGLTLAAAASLGLRAPPTTDMAVTPTLRPSRKRAVGPSFPSRRPIPGLPGTPNTPEPSGGSGQHPPA
jgi:hypothetical protein